MPDDVTEDDIRSRFSDAMSTMYRSEVPQYGTLLNIVAQVNANVLERQPALRRELEVAGELERLGAERHGAIRLGTANELSTMRRLFRVMGMSAVGYYDLAPAGVPVHSTAFRAIGEASLNKSPFRVFTSLLRLDLIEDRELRDLAAATLKQRTIFTPRVLQLIEKYEQEGRLDRADADEFVAEALETFRWHRDATVSERDYRRLISTHRLVADVVSFRGPHINHLTPRALDIDVVQEEMPRRGIAAKAVIEGPPRRKCPILLRQTSFKALEETIQFRGKRGADVAGSHTARFGEIEQRGVALTPTGRELYDHLLEMAREAARPDEADPTEYGAALFDAFRSFPDDYHALHARKLAYFRYRVADEAKVNSIPSADRMRLTRVIGAGAISIEPIVYEDFLPVSAAGIFRSNLGDDVSAATRGRANQSEFEYALGERVRNEFELYEEIQAASLARCEAGLGCRFSDA
ncbi:2-oxoadipate dioxygenase/decarboxylase HglS [Bradyrhizobium sp. USDA 4452]